MSWTADCMLWVNLEFFSILLRLFPKWNVFPFHGSPLISSSTLRRAAALITEGTRPQWRNYCGILARNAKPKSSLSFPFLFRLSSSSVECAIALAIVCDVFVRLLGLVTFHTYSRHVGAAASRVKSGIIDRLLSRRSLYGMGYGR